MAKNLIKAGFDVTIYDLDKTKAENLIEMGAKWSDSLSQGVSIADIVISSLPGPPQVAEVLLGENGIIASARPETIVIETSTSSVELAQQIYSEAQNKKVRFLEAPLTNAVDGAALGELAIFVGGDKDCFDDSQIVFDVIASDVIYVGKPGNGSITKLVTNLLWFVNAAAIGEGLMIGAKAEIPLETVWKAIKNSAGNSWVAEHDVPSIFAGHYDPSFSLGLCCKDLGLVNEIAKEQGFELPMGSLAQKLFEQAKSKYGAEAPELSVVKILEESEGILLRPTEVETQKIEVQKQSELMNEAHKHMPQGVAENYRYWGDERTVFVDNAKGCKFTDCEGKSYVDFRLGYGPIILGYGDVRVDNAVINQISRGGTLTGFSTALDTEVVKQIKAMCPHIEKMRFANSGTEAVMGAVRTARGYTKRNRIAIVEGGFHGLYDEMMWKSEVENWDPKGSTPPSVIPFGGGIPNQTRGLTDLLPLNNFEALENLFKTHGTELACIVLEPIIGNCGSISSSKEWLKKLKDLCVSHGTLLIMDEVKTGFRVAKGGAQELYGINADLTTYAKAMGNGYPVAAFGGRADVMDVIGSHAGGVVHGGTYTANLIGLAAAHKTLDILENTNALQTVDSVGLEIQKVLGKVFSSFGIEHTFAGPPSMFGIHFSSIVPTNYRDWRVTDSALYEAFAWNLIDGGVMLEPDSREPWFICESHRNLDLSWLFEVAQKAMKKALEAKS
ncbi:MAG: aminotransferase class III-fold pyridoxal phosphate-dependent enzyme [Bacteriovoracaceae bacterium]|nr:aminotransferase class III-fold pyridoxal phosphate-dependent enzyme [Bacteriovoracaceae bacterium]